MARLLRVTAGLQQKTQQAVQKHPITIYSFEPRRREGWREDEKRLRMQRRESLHWFRAELLDRKRRRTEVKIIYSCLSKKQQCQVFTTTLAVTERNKRQFVNMCGKFRLIGSEQADTLDPCFISTAVQQSLLTPAKHGRHWQTKYRCLISAIEIKPRCCRYSTQRIMNSIFIIHVSGG